MTRYSLHVQLVPVLSELGAFHLYVSHNVWEGHDCNVGPIQIYGRKVHLQEARSEDDLLHFAIEAMDLAYQETTQELAKVKMLSDGETNARPSDTSVP